MWQVIGHGWAVELLQRSLASDHVAHTYLITGPEHIGKRHLAREFATALVCSADSVPCHACHGCVQSLRGVHPDVHVVEPEGGRLRIDQVRGLQYTLSLSPRLGERRICLLVDVHRATAEAANALLKTLEEPPAHAVLVLTAADASLLLPTIVSRCQVLSLRRVPTDVLEGALAQRHVASDHAAELAHLASGLPGWALSALEEPGVLEGRRADISELEGMLGASRAQRLQGAERLAKREDIEDLLLLWQTLWRDVLLAMCHCAEHVRNVDKVDLVDGLARTLSPVQALDALQRTRRTVDHLAHNVNTRLAVESLLLGWPRLPATRGLAP